MSRSGWAELVLENEELRVTMLPDKGADIVGFEHKASGVDPLFRAPWGLQPAGSEPREGSAGHAFLENYGGGWQELFPNAGDPCTYGGETIPFHGEVATVPWSCERRGDGHKASFGEARLRRSEPPDGGRRRWQRHDRIGLDHAHGHFRILRLFGETARAAGYGHTSMRLIGRLLR